MRLRTTAPIVVPRKPARIAGDNPPRDVPTAKPVMAPTAVPTNNTINRLAEVILLPPFWLGSVRQTGLASPGIEYASSPGPGKARNRGRAGRQLAFGLSRR